MNHIPGSIWRDHLGVDTETCTQCHTTRQISGDGLLRYPWQSGPDCRGQAVQGGVNTYTPPSHDGKHWDEMTPVEQEAKKQELKDLFA